MIGQLSPREVARHMANDHPIHLVDVRQLWEHEIAALANSILIPLPELAGRTHELNLPKEELIVVYCHHGIRSLSGARILQQASFTNVVSLSGGIDAWSAEVDPTLERY